VSVQKPRAGKPARRPPRRGTWPQSSPLADAHGPIVHAIFRISRKNRAMVGNLLRPLGLFPGQELLLCQLWERDGRSQGELIAGLGIDHSTVSKMLARMQRAGWVECRASSRDQRAVAVRLTAEGRRLQAEVKRVLAELERETVAALRAPDRAELLRLLRIVESKLNPVAEAITPPLRRDRARTAK
jgi:DNA-binding MarR family transcriptional regulator